jgi:hypothetical protein
VRGRACLLIHHANTIAEPPEFPQQNLDLLSLQLLRKTLGAVLRQAATSARLHVCFLAANRCTFVQPLAPHAPLKG